MSGTLASRYQGRFGYRPALRVLPYPSPMEPPGDMLLPPPQQQPPQPPPVAPAAPQPAPVYAGAMPQDGANNDPGFAGYGQWGEDQKGRGGSFGQFGWGAPNYGQIGGLVGGLAGLALGVPGLGLAASALGTLADVTKVNSLLSEYGAPTIGLSGGLSALANNLTFGQLGESLDRQVSAVSPLGSTWGPYGGIDPEAAQPGGTQPAQPGGMPGPTINYDDSYGYGMGVGGGGYGNNDTGVTGNHDNGMGAGFGYMHGGYTGAGDDGIVQPWKPAGVVHEGELVIPAHIVSRLARLAQIN
jgi:hypothetical protein